MITYKSGDILKEDAEALINTVNCEGVMGRGIALQFKNAFPENFKAYAAACKRGEVQPGNMFVFQTGKMVNPQFIINFPTKRKWRNKSRMADIESGLKALVETLCQYGIRSVAIPPLGCGLGGLSWTSVKSHIEAALKSQENIQIVVYEPSGAPAVDEMVHTSKVPSMTSSRAVLLGLMYRYLCGLLDPFISLLEIHKLMYFMQEVGEPLKLNFQKGAYGPYAENLRHQLSAVEGHFISGYADGGDDPEKEITPMPDAVKDAERLLSNSRAARQRFEKVLHLVDGFESAFGLELLATVHWVVKNESIDSFDDVVKHVHEWSPRKQRLFTPRQIGIAVDVLTQKGWFDISSAKKT